MKLTEHKSYSGMYFIEWPDGALSADFYNYTRANWYRRNLQWDVDYRGIDSGPTEPADAFK